MLRRWLGEGEGAGGGREGGDKGRATRQAACKVMTRGTHLTAVYPALFYNKKFDS